MTYQFEALGLTVNTCGWTSAGETGAIHLGISTFKPVIFSKVVACAEWADNGIFGAPTKLNHVTKGMATVALFDERK